MVRVYVAIGGLLVAALLTVFVAPLFIDWSQYRERFEAEASRVLGREVRVGGDASARLLPFPSVTFDDVRIAPDGGLGLEVEQFEMDLELAPFLRGEVLIFDMRMLRPRLSIVLDESGTLPTMTTERRFDGDAVSIERLEITDGSVVARTPRGEARATDLDAVLRADTLSGPWTGEGRANVVGERLTFDLTTGRARPDQASLRVLLNVAAESLPAPIGLAGDLSVQDGVPTYEGDVTSSRSAEDAIPFVLTGEFTATPNGLDLPEYRAALGQRDDPYVIVGSAGIGGSPEPAFNLEMRGQRLETTRLAPDALPGGTTMRERFDALERLVDGLPRLPIGGEVDVSLPAIVLPDGVAQDVRLRAKAEDGRWQIENASALLPGRTRVETSGSLEQGDALTYRGDFAIASRQPTGLAAWLGNPIDDALRETDAIGVAGDVVLARDQQAIENLQIVLGPDKLRGRYSNDGASGSVELAGEVIDIERAQSALAATFGETAFASDLRFDVAFDRATIGDLLLEDTAAVGTVGAETVQFDRLTIGSLAGAEITAEGTYALEPDGTSEVSISLNSVEPADALRVLAERTNADWAELLAERGDTLSLLRSSIDLVWIDPTETIGVEASGRANGVDWTLGGSLQAPNVAENAAPVVEMVSASGSFGGPLAELLTVAKLPVGAGAAARDISVEFEYERTADGHRADLSANGEGDIASLTAVADANGTFLRSQSEIASLTPYVAALGSPLAERTDVSFDGLIDATHDGTFWTVQMEEVQVGDVLLTGRMVGSDWRWQGALDTGSVDLEWLAALPVDDDFRDDLSAEFGASPLPPIDMLLSVDARVADFGDSLATRDATMQIRLTGDAVSIEEFRGSVANGMLAGDLTVRNSGTGALVSANAILTDADASVLPPAIRPQLDGQISAEASIEATGSSPVAVLRSATGAGTVTIESPIIDGLDPFALPNIYERVDALTEPPDDDTVRDAVLAEAFDARFEPDTVVANVSLGSGVARITVPPVSDEGTQLRARGRLDLVERNLSGDATITFAVPDDRGTGGNPSVRVSIDSLDGSPEVDVGPLTGFLNLRAFEIERERVDALRAALIEQQRLRRETLLFDAEAREAEREAERSRELEAEAAIATEAVQQRAAPTPQLNFETDF